jgi:hypothetical protein
MSINSLVSQASIVSNDPVRVNTAISGRESRSQISSQYWTINVTLKTLSETETRTVMALIATAKTGLNTFSYTPAFATNASTFSASIVAVNTTAVAATSMSVRSGTNPGSEKPIKAGEFFKFANHNKVYMATSDLTLTLSGANYDGTLSFYPALQASVASSEVITYTSVPFTVRLASDPGLAIGLELFGGMQMDLKEVI